MEFLFIAGGALVVPVFIAIAAIGLLGAGLAIEIGALATETVTLRSLPAAWASRRHKRLATEAALPDRANVWSRLRFLRAPAIAHWSLWLSLASAGLLVTIIAIPAMNYLLFEQFLLLALRGVEHAHGVVVTYESAEGNTLKGLAELRGARALRHGHAISDFDLTIERLFVDCDVRKLISGHYAFQSVDVSSIRGRFTQTGQLDPSQPRRHYTIDRLTINDVRLDCVDRSRPPRVMQVPLQLTSLEVNDFRSRWRVFDVLFRSQTRGTIYGQPFEITSRTAGEAHESIFKVADLPLSLMGQRISAPFGGRVYGLVNADIRTRWQPQDELTDLKMHCQLLAHSFTVAMPNSLARAVVAPAMAFRPPRNVPLEFDLVMNEQSFDGHTSILATGILERIGDEASRKRRQVSSQPTNRANRAFGRSRGGVRSLAKPSSR